MPIQLKAGSRLFSAADSTEFIVVRAPSTPIELTIGGHPARLDAGERDEGLQVLTPAESTPAMGRRYVDEHETLELLCTKPGAAAAAVDGLILTAKDAKPLPSSD
jgi:hypothetical protein